MMVPAGSVLLVISGLPPTALLLVTVRAARASLIGVEVSSAVAGGEEGADWASAPTHSLT